YSRVPYLAVCAAADCTPACSLADTCLLRSEKTPDVMPTASFVSSGDSATLSTGAG
ncbi:hypothetical protein GGI22_007030, partial [Coemansia erecta]